MKKILFIISVIFSIASLQAMQQSFGSEKTSVHLDHEQRIGKIEKHLQLDINYYDYLTTYSTNMYVMGDFLYWTTENNGWLGYYKSSTNGGDMIGSFHNRDFDWSPGFRIGVAAKTPLDWDVLLNYTRYHHTSTDIESGYLFMSFTAIPIGYVQTNLKVKSDIVDLEFGRPFHVGQTLSLKSHIGLRGGWIKEIGENTARDDLSPAPGSYTTPIFVHFQDKFYLIGPRAGIETDLIFSKTYGFSLYGNLAGALMYGRVKSILSNYVTETATGNNHLYYRSPMKDSDLKATLQCGFGFSWGDFITDDDSAAFRIRAGWEANYWWNMIYQYQVDATIGFPSLQNYNEPLIFQGFVLNTRLDF